jgi:hypothetical protein
MSLNWDQLETQSKERQKEEPADIIINNLR